MALINGCNDKKDNSFTEKTRLPGKHVRYFKSWASYELPIRPVDEISKKEAEELSKQYAYYEARYDSAGKLTSFKKHLNSEIIREIEYFYDPNDIVVKCETTNPSDPNTGMMEQYFDLSGTYIKLRELDNKGHLVKEEIISSGKKDKK